jgi:CheY-like chemotaxis protein
VARILIIEDNPDNMKLFAAVLGLHGHAVVGRADGQGLLEVLDTERPDLILMDIQLPGQDGFALLSEIRRSHHRNVRVVALTAHAMTGDEDRAMEAGFDGYITKPINVRSFPDQVAAALGGGAERTLHSGLG